MLTCKQASELISADYDRHLRVRERLSLRMHLLICGACRVAARQIALIQQFVASKPDSDLSFADNAHLSEEACQRITHRIAKQPN